MMGAIGPGFEVAESPVDVERMGFGMMEIMASREIKSNRPPSRRNPRHRYFMAAFGRDFTAELFPFQGTKQGDRELGRAENW
jgi:hypothetical protein